MKIPWKPENIIVRSMEDLQNGNMGNNIFIRCEEKNVYFLTLIGKRIMRTLM